MTVVTDTTLGPATATASARHHTDEQGWPIVPPTLLTVHRRSPRDERSRQIVCKLDGTWVADVLFGQEHSVEILPGTHELRLHNTLMWRTVRFTVPPGGHARVGVVNRAPSGFHALLLFIGVAPLVLEVEAPVVHAPPGW